MVRTSNRNRTPKKMPFRSKGISLAEKVQRTERVVWCCGEDRIFFHEGEKILVKANPGGKPIVEFEPIHRPYE